MSEDPQFAEHMVASLRRNTRYGWNRAVPGLTVRTAWPATGDKNETQAGQILELMNAVAGAPPEKGRTTLERFAEALGPEFKVVYRGEWDEFHIHRDVKACPHCGGTGYLRPKPESRMPTSSEIQEIVPWQKCNHIPPA